MDHEADRVQTTSTRPSAPDRRRNAITWPVRTVTVTILFVAVVSAIVGVRVATAHMERESMALISSGGPTIIDREQPPATADAIQPPTIEGSSTTTTTTESRSGAAASPSVSPESESPSVLSSGSASAEERGRWALEQISYPWQERLPGWTVEFDDGREGLFGLTLVDDKRIEVYVRHDQTDDLLVHIVAHELGHAVDVTLNKGGDRRAWQAARGIENEPWWPSSASSDFRTGAGDFAESFAYWQAESDNFRSKLGPPPSADQLELMAALAID
ncbi:MAG: hypothetical protein OEZ14_07760 [Acidimicrobiia bacterium]|nr:hypothetical protein [Acidimicrobiia bacterium]